MSFMKIKPAFNDVYFEMKMEPVLCFQDHDGLELHIGISPLGLTVYHKRCKINFFPW